MIIKSSKGQHIAWILVMISVVIISFRPLLDTKFDKPENNIVPIENGGTNSADGAIGLANLFAAGATILSSNQYGDALPEAGTVGRIFFKRLIDV